MSTFSSVAARNQWAGVPTRPEGFIPMEELPNTRRLNPEQELLVREELGQLLARDGQFYADMQRDGVDLDDNDPLVVLTERLSGQNTGHGFGRSRSRR